MRAPGAILSGIGGFATDVYRMATCQLTNPHSYLKFLTINRVRKETGSTTAIETGTYLGGTAYRCSKVFEKVYTIELDAALANEAKRNLKRCANVEVIEGDAVVALEKLFREHDFDRATIFLDGHFSGNGTACGILSEPAVAELEVLGRYIGRISGIVIDDFRTFGVESGAPTKSQLLEAVERQFPSTQFGVQIQNDMVILMRRPKSDLSA